MVSEDELSKPTYKDICELQDEEIQLTGISRFSNNETHSITYKILGDESGITYESTISNIYTTQNILDAVCSLGNKGYVRKFLTEEQPTYRIYEDALLPTKLTEIDRLGVWRFPEGRIPFSFWTYYEGKYLVHYYIIRYFINGWLEDGYNRQTPDYERKKEFSDTILNIKDMYWKMELGDGFHPEILDGLYNRLDDFLNYLCNGRNETFIMCFVPSSNQGKPHENCIDYLMKMYPRDLPKNIVIRNDLLLRKENLLLPNHNGGKRSKNCRTIYIDSDCEDVVRDKHIILMDDLAASGTTTDYVSKILSEAGARHVTCITLSKAYDTHKRRK